MPFLNSQNPAAYGWESGSGATILPFAWRSHSGVGSFGAVSFPQGVAAGTEGIWTAFLNELEPQIQGGILQGESWGYENRANVNDPSKKSFHSYGLALDINAVHNPNGSKVGTGKYQVPPAAGPIAAKYGMLWGGEFTGTTDPMHFELHLSPAEVQAFPASGVASPDTGTGEGGANVGAHSLEIAAGIGVLIIVVILALFTFI